MNYWEEMDKRVKTMIDEVEKQVVRKSVIPIFELLDFTTTVTEIKCDKCGHCDKSYIDEWEAVNVFFDNGWKIINKKCWCPVCIKEKD